MEFRIIFENHCITANSYTSSYICFHRTWRLVVVFQRHKQIKNIFTASIVLNFHVLWFVTDFCFEILWITFWKCCLLLSFVILCAGRAEWQSAAVAEKGLCLTRSLWIIERVRYFLVSFGLHSHTYTSTTTTVAGKLM